MYNGIGLQTARGSGTNGYVQRNLAHVKMSKEKPSYRTEEDIKKADAVLNRPPNKEILEHEKQRKVEVKCFELRELMEEQGYAEDEIDSKVNQYRELLKQQVAISEGPTSEMVDDYGRPMASETHQIAELQQQKNSRLKDAFGIDKDYVDGSAIERNTQKTETGKLKPGKADARRDHDNRTVEKDENVSIVKEKPIEHNLKNESEKSKRDRKSEKRRSKDKKSSKRGKRKRNSSSSDDDSSDQDSSSSSSSSSDNDDDTSSSSSSSSESSTSESSSSSSSSSSEEDESTSLLAKKRKRPVEHKKSIKSKNGDRSRSKYERSEKSSAKSHGHSRSAEKKTSRRDDRTPPKKRRDNRTPPKKSR